MTADGGSPSGCVDVVPHGPALGAFLRVTLSMCEVVGGIPVVMAQEGLTGVEQEGHSDDGLGVHSWALVFFCGTSQFHSMWTSAKAVL